LASGRLEALTDLDLERLVLEWFNRHLPTRRPLPSFVDDDALLLIRSGNPAQRVKSKAGVRVVALHPELLRIGFLEFVTAEDGRHRSPISRTEFTVRGGPPKAVEEPSRRAAGAQVRNVAPPHIRFAPTGVCEVMCS
jgi:hypothetical protein